MILKLEQSRQTEQAPLNSAAALWLNDAARLLKKKKIYFSGGTVDASIADVDFVRRREGVEEHFEDGTISFLSIASISVMDLKHSIPSLHLQCAGISAFQLDTCRLRISIAFPFSAFSCKWLNLVSSQDSGSIVSFNLKRPDGSWLDIERWKNWHPCLEFSYGNSESQPQAEGFQLIPFAQTYHRKTHGKHKKVEQQ
ncbi:hypothetical protein PTKIN_Ptkin14bG0215300 [Pterospermum kingtungense]